MQISLLNEQQLVRNLIFLARGFGLKHEDVYVQIADRSASR